MMVRSALFTSTVLGALFAPTLAAAQSAEREQVIVITAPRGLPAPLRSLDGADIDSYGAGSIGELLEQVTSEEGEGSPVVLINGKRASGLAELSDYPPEALAQVEILPVGSGVTVGASPNRKVVNLVLRRRFDGKVGRAGTRVATDGGWRSGRVEGTLTRIRGDSRLNLTLRGRTESELSEAERDLDQPVGALPGEAAARSLLPSLNGVDLSLSGATPLGANVDLSTTGRLSWTRRERGLGLSAAGEGLTQQTSVIGGRLNSTINAELSGWSISVLGALDADRRLVRTDLDGLADDEARSRLRSLSTQLEMSAVRPLFSLPAGMLQLNLGAGAGYERFRSVVRRSGAVTPDRFTERSVTASAGLVVPIAGGPKRFLAPLGELNLSGDVGVAKVSGGASFLTRTASLIWQPVRPLRLTAAVTRSSNPLADRFRREAVVETPDVLVFDPIAGESVRVIEIVRPLSSSARTRTSQERLAVSYQPSSPVNLRVESEWSRRRERNLASSLPALSPLLFDAFPERFIRADDGSLISVDASPLLFASRREMEWRNAISLRFLLGPARRPAAGAAEEEADAGEERARSGARTRLQFNLSHVLLLSSRLTVREGLPAIDLLSGSGILFAGGRPRHRLEASANLSSAGAGLRLTAAYRSPSRLALGDGTGESDELRFGALTTFSLRAFANAERLFGRSTLTKGTRLSLGVENLRNAREQVRDRQGLVPLAYQPAYRDALGRTIEFEVRRVF